MRQFVYRLGWPQLAVVIGALGLLLLAGLVHSQTQVVPTVAAAPAVSTPAPVAQPRVDCAVAHCLALTFDDGPDAKNTPRILDVLERHHARATFFIMGWHVKGNEQLLQRMHRDGYEIGNHSWNHPHFTRITPEEMDQQITKTQTAIMRAGVPAPQLFRPPYGDTDAAVVAQVPLAVVRWNIDPEDWSPSHRAHMLEHLQQFAKPGGIVVLHDTEDTTADALDVMLTQLEGQYQLVTVSELLNISPGQRGMFFGR